MSEHGYAHLVHATISAEEDSEDRGLEAVKKIEESYFRKFQHVPSKVFKERGYVEVLTQVST